MSNLLKSFKKNGVVALKNFFTDQEVSLLTKRVNELAKKEFDFIYIINKKKIQNSFLIKSKFTEIREELLKNCLEEDFKIKTLENFTDHLKPLLEKNGHKDYILEELHAIFCENSLLSEDILYDEVLSSIFFTDKVLNIYRELLQTNELIYHGESQIGYNKAPDHGWHSDDNPNYQENTFEDTFQLRGGFFFQSDSKNSGGTKFLLGSHKYISPSKLLKKIIKKLLKNKNFNNSILNTRILRSKNFFSDKKDFVVWDKRIIHSPWAVKIKKFSWLSIAPTIERYFYKGSFPRILAEKNSFPRSLGNLDIGRKSISRNSYVNYLSQREDYKEYWKKKTKLLSKEFLEKLSSKNVFLDDSCIQKWKNID